MYNNLSESRYNLIRDSSDENLSQRTLVLGARPQGVYHHCPPGGEMFAKEWDSARFGTYKRDEHSSVDIHK